MKKSLLAILMVLSMLAMFAGPVAAAPLADGTATLVSVVYVPGKGPVFTFEVSGSFSKAELKGQLHVQGGGDYDLDCIQEDETTVKCTTSDKAAGMNVTLAWGGSIYWTSVPPAREKNCYDIWDYWDFTNYEWANFGPYCQGAPAQTGDEITYTVPDPNGNFEAPVWFLEDGVCPYFKVPNHGAAYYWCTAMQINTTY